MSKKTILSNEELSFFTGQIAVMLESGIPLYESIEVLADNYQSTEYGEAFKTIYNATDCGEQLAGAMERSGIFPRYAVKMTGVGEATGKLEQVMKALSRHYAREEALSSSIKNALRYPAMLLSIMALVVVIINWKVLPLFKQVLINLGSESAAFSDFTMNVGTVIGFVALGLVVLLVLCAVITAVMLKKGKKHVLIGLISRVSPAIAKLQRAISAERFLSILSIALKAGYPPESAAETCAEPIDDADSLEKINHIVSLHAGGGSLCDAITSSGLLEPLKARMVRVGFMTGRVDEVTENVAKLYSAETDEKLERLLSLIEPALVTMLAIIIGCVLLTVMLPLAGVMSSFL